ncbi:MAG: hypothetical protein ACOCRX_07040 [Candidatus Woesearchaeota archaeon]
MNELEWRKIVCKYCPYHYSNFKNSYKCLGDLLTIRKNCVFYKKISEKG